MRPDSFLNRTIGRGVIPVWLIVTAVGVGATFLVVYVFHSRRVHRPIVDLMFVVSQTDAHLEWVERLLAP